VQTLNNDYPEISFVDRDVDPLVRNLILTYERFTGRTLFPADPTRLFILWIADIIVQERVIINDSAKQNVPRYARGDFFFATEENVGIPPGELFADVSAVCITEEPDGQGGSVTVGARGNGFLPGQITRIVDVFPNFHAVENITTSEGGANREEDDAYYVRMSEALESFTTAGSLGAYIFWAKTASPLIADVRPTSPEPGVADIRILLQGGQLPGDEMLQLVHDTLSDGENDGVRPFTDYVIVKPPDPVYFDIDLVYFIPTSSRNSETTIARAVETAVTDYKEWQSQRMGRDINPDKLTTLIKTAGAKRSEITTPQFTVIHDTEVAIVRNVNIVYGGLEDE